MATLTLVYCLTMYWLCFRDTLGFVLLTNLLGPFTLGLLIKIRWIILCLFCGRLATDVCDLLVVFLRDYPAG